ncbi:MAG: gluconokinase [Burkholderiales bacterium]|nr:gluconokinase [Burkholderiales bacterium]MDE2397884.1 gluconokinase [Burkholderiales bacterium]
MGVSGCGKSTLGRALAAALAVGYVEGDEWHPPRNVALMAAGTPLTDADRADWLATLAGRLGAAQAAGQGLVLACSALKRSYRDRLRQGAPGLRFVFLHGSPELLARRLEERRGHYMPATLLQSQLDTLEPPGADEQPISVAIEWPPAQQLAAALAGLSLSP